MGELSDRSGAEDWTELERGFFEAAPPEVAVTPGPVVTFDDLLPARPARLERRRVPRTPRRAAPPPMPGQVARAVAFLRALAANAGAAARPMAGRLLRRTYARLGSTARGAGPAARLLLERGLAATRARLARDLPERPDGKTIAAALAALVVVFGVSASVLGSRNPRPAVTVTAPVAPSPPPLAELAAPEPEAAPPLPVTPPQAEPVVPRHHHRHHALRAAVATKPATKLATQPATKPAAATATKPAR